MIATYFTGIIALIIFMAMHQEWVLKYYTGNLLLGIKLFCALSFGLCMILGYVYFLLSINEVKK